MLIDRVGEALRPEQIIFSKLSIAQPATLSLPLLLRVRKEIKKNKADVLHLHDAALIPLGVVIGKSCLMKVVATIYDVPTKKVGGWWLGALDRIIFNSQYTRDQFQYRYGLKARQYSIIPCAALEEELPLSPLSREELQITADSFIVASIGPLERTEDPITLLKAVRKLQKKNAKVALLMTGDGPMKSEVEKFINEEGLQPSVKMLNGKIDPRRLLSLADVYVTSCFGYSKEEQILQAMARRKPVIATKIFNHQELIDDGRTGILVPCGYPERIETAIMRFTIKKDELQAMGQAAGEFAARNFSVLPIARQYQQVY